MSWDVSLQADLGGEFPVQVTELDVNYTHNTNSMFRAALVATGHWEPLGIETLYDLDGISPGSLAPALRDCVLWLDTDEGIEACAPLAPDNGWGSREGLILFLSEIHDACLEAPKASVRWSG